MAIQLSDSEQAYHEAHPMTKRSSDRPVRSGYWRTIRHMNSTAKLQQELAMGMSKKFLELSLTDKMTLKQVQTPGCSYDGHWRLTWSLTSGPVGLVERQRRQLNSANYPPFLRSDKLLDEDPAVMQRCTFLAKRLELYRSAQAEIDG
ncbi:hypothetical protein NC653_032960 [Populus alba x Populus x berolinensis]|uniref:Uncharacterized protein n=1 Tax=Populus alba x Populus x berolinensis TaxID=444605 RepID=A0AAD6LSJ3_9ROSI|nr:hypothetical protein NC653_032960 [Populus alba x Populus x berolinensis]